MPASQEEIADQVHGAEKHKPEEGGEEHGREQKVGPELAVGGNDQDAQPGGTLGDASKELAGDGADHGEARGDTEPRQDVGQRRRELELEQRGAPARAVEAEEVAERKI